MATPLNTQKIPPVPSSQDILEKEQKVITQPWQQWFQQIRDKVNVITASIVALAGNATAGFLSSDGAGGITSRTLVQGTGITITNGDGVAGNPVISATASGGAPINIVNNTAASYTVLATDLPSSSSSVGWIASNVSTANTIKIDTHANQSIPIGAHLFVSEEGAGQTSIQSVTGVTFVGSTITAVAKGVGEAVQIATDVWHVFGNLAYSATPLYSAVILTDTPYGYWRLGETTGSTAIDIGTGANNGTYVSCTLGAASLTTNNGGNLAVSGDGTTSQITVGAIAALYTLNRTFSIEAWIKPASISGASGIWSAGLNGFCLRQNGSGIEFLQDYSSSIRIVAVGLIVGTIYHIVITVDASGNYVLYINGSSFVTGTFTVTFSGSYVRIGADGNNSTGVDTFLGGELDEVAVYNSVLSPARVLAHYNAGI